MTTSLKTCFKCELALPVDDFYRHPRMADGRLGKCKLCTRADNSINRALRLEKYREYDRQRGKLESRANERKERSKTPRAKALNLESMRRYRAKYPERDAARQRISRAIREGKVARPDGCWACGIRCIPHAHHSDYSRPLSVIWLCQQCHTGAHNITPTRKPPACLSH